MSTLLELKDFNVKYISADKEIFAVKDINLKIKKGESIGLVGESGSGKTTLAMGFSRLLPENVSKVTGEAIFADKNLLAIDDEELRQLRWTKLALVFQKAMNSFSPVHRIGTQIEDIYRVHKKNASKVEILERIEYLLKLVNLPMRVYKLYPHEMSGGMLQRVSIAVSLLYNPELLIMDEATTALDVITQGQILKEVLEMEKNLNVTRIMITHDISVVSSSCQKIAVMYAGELLETGYVKDVVLNPLHPYTKGLLSSFPSLKGEKVKLKGIKGSLPDLSKKYDCCIFEDRCPISVDECRRDKPVERYLENDRMAKCIFAGGEDNK